MNERAGARATGDPSRESGDDGRPAGSAVGSADSASPGATGLDAAAPGPAPGQLGPAPVPASVAAATSPAARTSPRAPASLARGAGPALRQLAILAAYLAAGVAATWPRATYLAGTLPANRDAGGFVWDLWWVAHQVSHLGNPWFTRDIAAPVGAQLGYHTLMPLPGLILTPVTLTLGPGVSYNLLETVAPGLLCYAMYRTARLWLPGGIGPLAAGAFFGLSPIMAWNAWYEGNLAAGALFLPLAAGAAVRLRRQPCLRRAVVLGVVTGAAVLTDQESAVLASLLVALVLAPWLLRSPRWERLWPIGAAVASGAVIASPQLAAMAQQSASGNAGTPLNVVAHFYNPSGAGLVQMFAPSPRLATFGLSGLTSLYYQGRTLGPVVGYGVVLTVLALTGLAVSRRRRSAWALAALWLGASVMALGSAPLVLGHEYRPLAQLWHGVPMSALMPFTWLVRLPGMAGFREASRFTEVGLVGAALLAGAAVSWLADRAWPVLVVVLALAVAETGWSGNAPGTWPGAGRTIPTAMPALDGPIAADHSRSVVVDVPFGIRGGLPVLGGAFPPESMVLATADGHPLADALISRIPAATRTGITRHAFYAGLLSAQGGSARNSPATVAAARRSAARMNIGWVLVWVSNDAVDRFLRETGFALAYRADGVAVYRPLRRLDGPAATRPG